MALKLDPKEATIYVERAQAKIYKGDYDGAIDDFSRLSNLIPRIGRQMKSWTS